MAKLVLQHFKKKFTTNSDDPAKAADDHHHHGFSRKKSVNLLKLTLQSWLKRVSGEKFSLSFLVWSLGRRLQTASGGMADTHTHCDTEDLLADATQGEDPQVKGLRRAREKKLNREFRQWMCTGSRLNMN